MGLDPMPTTPTRSEGVLVTASLPQQAWRLLGRGYTLLPEVRDADPRWCVRPSSAAVGRRTNLLPMPAETGPDASSGLGRADLHRCPGAAQRHGAPRADARSLRSEERRVGKECR